MSPIPRPDLTSRVSSGTAKMIVRGAVKCGICDAPADRYDWGFQCQATDGHKGDPVMGIFSDLTPPRSRN